MPSSYQFALWKQESFLVPSAFFRNLLEGLLVLPLWIAAYFSGDANPS